MQTAPPEITFSSPEWIKLFAAGQHEALSKEFLRILGALNVLQLNRVDGKGQYFVDHLVKVFLGLFTEVEFKIPDAHVQQYISYNHLIMNLVAISSFRTTDAHLSVVIPQEGNFAKILTLLNPRCRTKMNREILFGFHPEMASLWYASYACAYYGALQNRTAYENLREHFAFRHPKLGIRHQIQEAYFGSTYAGDNLDQVVKPVVNRCCQEMLAGMAPVVNTPKRNKVAVISALWLPGTSVFRTYSECIAALRPKYHLTFISLGVGDRRNVPVPEGFDEVRHISAVDGRIDFSAIQNNDFQVVIFPDIGMADISVLLANMQIAPVQIALTGHPVSTFGARTNYFISGADVEIADRPERNYSERLVLIPGMGVVHNVPLYTFQNLKKTLPKNDDSFVINALCWAQKINHPFVQTLRKLIAASARKVKIRIFTGNSLSRGNDRVPFVRDLGEQLGVEHVEVMPPLDYKTYMSHIEQGDLTVDSYPFGGSNTVSDSLFARVPVVVWQSDKWYGRIGSEMLRLVGLEECVSRSEEEFLAIAGRLINDDTYRSKVTEKLRKADLESTIYNKSGARYFAKAIDTIIEQHERNQGAAAQPGTEPIRIQAD